MAFLFGRRQKKNRHVEKDYPSSSEYDQSSQKEYNYEAAPSELGPPGDSQQAQQSAWRETLDQRKVKLAAAEMGTEHRARGLPYDWCAWMIVVRNAMM